MRDFPRNLRTTCSLLVALLLPACAIAPFARGQAIRFDESARRWTASDGGVFPYQAWLPAGTAPKAIVIGVHGLSGAVHDHQALAEKLRLSGYGFYGYELRGQGNDPVKERVGDIQGPRIWQHDLWAFHKLVAAKHPNVPILWLGESLGSLIVCGAAVRAPHDTSTPDGLILASPIPAFDDRVSIWHRQLLGVAALADPTKKIPLSQWTGPDALPMTANTQHLEQLDHTPWAVPAFTVRFYNVVSILVGRMMPQARRIQQPVLVLRAAKDVFASGQAVQEFAKKLPRGRLTIYPASHHLLFYDIERDNVSRDIIAWLESKPWIAEFTPAAPSKPQSGG